MILKRIPRWLRSFETCILCEGTGIVVKETKVSYNGELLSHAVELSAVCPDCKGWTFRKKQRLDF